MYEPWSSIGDALGSAFWVYGIALLLGLYFAHPIAALIAVFSPDATADRARVGWHVVRRALELVYGFVNPLVYLLVLAPAMAPQVAPVLSWTAAFVFACYWSARIVGVSWIPSQRQRVAVRALLLATMAAIVAIASRDMFFAPKGPLALLGRQISWPALTLALYGLGSLSLYAAPFALVWRQWRALVASADAAEWFSRTMLLPRVLRGVGIAFLGCIGLAVSTSLLTPGHDEALASSGTSARQSAKPGACRASTRGRSARSSTSPTDGTHRRSEWRSSRRPPPRG